MPPINIRTGQPFQASQIGLIGTDKGDEQKYRRFTGGAQTKDLTPISYDKAREMAFYQWQRYPLSKRFIEILMDFCSGEELKVNAKIKQRNTEGGDSDTEREDAQKVWDDFWCDPINDLDGEFDTIVQDLLLNGESALPQFTNEADGKVYLGYFDPTFIKDVITLPTNQRVVDTLKMRAPGQSEDKDFKVVRFDMDPTSPNFRKMSGEVFYFRINYSMSQKRGYPEATEYLDWMDAFEQFLFAVLKGFDARNAFFHDVTMEGVDEKKLANMTMAAPGMGEVKLHNEKVKWEVMTPDLKAVDASEATRLIKNFITGTKGFPEHFFGDGGNTNLATAQVMSVPTVKMIKRKQKAIRRIIKYIGQYVFEQAQEKGRLKLAENEYVDIEVSMFDIERKEAAVIGSAFVQLTTALSVAASKNWVSDETAKKIVDGLVAMLGVEVDEDESVEMIKQKNESQSEEDIISGMPPINDHLKNKNDGTPKD